MKRRAALLRNIQVILATAAGLVLVVAAAVGWLGWKLLSQEETLARQQSHNRLEQTADVLFTAFTRRMTETEAWLSRVGSSLAGDGSESASRPMGAILVRFSQTAVEAQPPG